MPAVGQLVRTMSTTNDTVAVVGSEPEIYFYARRHSATGYLYMYPLMEPQPYATQMQREMMSEIESNQPALLVLVSNPDSWNVRPASDPGLLKWFSQYSGAHYERVAIFGTKNDGTSQNRADNQFIVVLKRKSPEN